MKKVLCILTALSVLFISSSCGCNKNVQSSSASSSGASSPASVSSVPAGTIQTGPSNVVKENVEKPIVTKKSELNTETTNLKLPMILNENELKLTKIFKYDGFFAEDGSNAETSDAIAAEFENISGKYIYYALVTFTLSSGKEIKFDMSYIPPGEKIVVQEAGNLKFSKEDTYKVKDCKVYYKENPDKPWDTSVTDFIKFQSAADDEKGNIAALTNNGKKELLTADIFYKIKKDGVLQGGITYKMTAVNIIPGETRYMQAAHFTPDSVIVDCSYTLSK